MNTCVCENFIFGAEHWHNTIDAALWVVPLTPPPFFLNVTEYTSSSIFSNYSFFQIIFMRLHTLIFRAGPAILYSYISTGVIPNLVLCYSSGYEYLFRPFQLQALFYLTHCELQYFLGACRCIHTYTHTHTYINIYIYINIHHSLSSQNNWLKNFSQYYFHVVYSFYVSN